ncbi:hypothetical protein HYZ97_00260 [Candidatus Pacearchaeota archaeon]|nr:hypothetical protein [Candidatus Pacearchaeota archaeon]
MKQRVQHAVYFIGCNELGEVDLKAFEPLVRHTRQCSQVITDYRAAEEVSLDAAIVAASGQHELAARCQVTQLKNEGIPVLFLEHITSGESKKEKTVYGAHVTYKEDARAYHAITEFIRCRITRKKRAKHY